MKIAVMGICLGALVTLASCGHGIAEKKLPSVVVNSVKSKYTNTTNIEWEKKQNGYEASFLQGQNDFTITVDNAGNIISQRQEIDSAALPAAIVTAINAQYTGFAIDEVEKLEMGGITYYQVELEKKGEKDLELVFTAEGKLAADVAYQD